MRIVTAQEAVAGIRSGEQLYVQCAAATPEVLLAALVARAAELARRRDRPPPHGGPGTAPRARDGAATSATGRCSSAPTRGARSTRAARTSCPCSCPTCRACSRAGALPLDAVFVNVTPPDSHGFCSLGTSRRGDARGDRVRDDGDRAAQPRDAAHARRSRSSTSTQIDLAVEVDEPVHEVARPVIGDVERRIGALRRGPRRRRRDAPARDRRDPGGDRRLARRQAGPGDPHRDVHGRRGGPRRGGRRHRGRARRATAARS